MNGAAINIRVKDYIQTPLLNSLRKKLRSEITEYKEILSLIS